MLASMQVLPSTQNKPEYPKNVIINPPNAGPAENPRFIASLIKVTDLVLFSGLLYAISATKEAGLNISAATIKTNIPPQNA